METILHKSKAYLYDNVLTKDNQNDLIARISSDRSLNIAQVSDIAVKRGGANISAASMTHAVELWLGEMAYQLCDDFAVNTGYFTAKMHINGVFDSPNERFNPEKHTLSVDFQQGALLRKELQRVDVEILGVADTALAVLQVTDVKSGSINDLITPNRNLRIVGQKLKIVGEDEANGVYFVNQDTQVRTKVDASDMVTNNPSELIIVIPVLTAGSYLLEVVTQYGGNSKVMLKESRKAIFNKTLTVQ
jgi:hypothetical protein